MPARTSRHRRRPVGRERTGSRPLSVLVIFNPAAANADQDRLRAALAHAFARRGLGYRLLTSGADDQALVRGLERAVAEGCRLVVAVGGDGTVSRVADLVSRQEVDPPIRLGIVPAGTANVLARELQLPLDVETAIAVIAEESRVVPVDALELDGHRYFTQIGIGLDAGMIESTTREAQRRFKRLAYLGALLQRARGHRARGFRIEADGRTMTAPAWQVVIANAGTLGARPFEWGPNIRVGDGIAELCLYRVRRWREVPGLLWSMLRGRHAEDARVEYLPVHDQVTITTRRPEPVQADGEIVTRTPITVRVHPGAVRVLVQPSRGQVVREDATGRPAPADTERAVPATVPVPPREQARVARHALMRIATLGAVDAALYLRINTLPGGAALGRAMVMASRALDHGEAWIAIAALAALADPASHRRLPFEVLPALWLTMLIVNLPLKAVFRRTRPFITYVKARVIGRRPADFSFPSGHTAAAFAGATMLAPALPGLAPLFYLYALVIGFARVFLGVHYPSDVVIGGIAGTVLGGTLGALMRALLPPA